MGKSIFDGRVQIKYSYGCYGMTRGGGKTWHGGMDIVGVDSDIMQMIPSGISGGTHFSDGIIFVYNIAGLDKELAAMGIKCTIPATMVDDQIISITDVIP